MRVRGIHFAMMALLSSAVLGVGCSDDATPSRTDLKVSDGGLDGGKDSGDGSATDTICNLKIATINGKAAASLTKLIPADDKDLDKAGIQIAVEVQSAGLTNGKVVTMSLTGVAAETQAASAGKASFAALTVDASLTQVVLKATAAGCGSDSLRLLVEPPPECSFKAPRNGDALGEKDDAISGNNTFDFTVVVGTQNAAGGKVALFVDGAQQGQQTPNGTGDATFANQVLNKGAVKLSAQVTAGGITRKCTADVRVTTSQPTCKLAGYTPAASTATLPGGGTKNGFGIAQDSDTVAPKIQTNIKVETEAVVTEVALYIDGAQVKKAANSGTTQVTVGNVTLDEGAHELKVSCTDTKSGNTGESAKDNVLVDSGIPEDVTDFACTVVDARKGQVKCTWTAVSDDAAGLGLGAYDVRYVVGNPVTTANWSTATSAMKVEARAKGQPQVADLKDLPLAKDYYFAVRAVDLVGNESKNIAASAKQSVGFIVQSRLGSDAQAKAYGAVMATGDFNCDGRSDVAVADATWNAGAGRVYIYLGQTNGLTPTPWKLISGTVAGGNFGAGLAALENFDADSSANGCTDLAVYAGYGADKKKARVYVYLGRPSNQFVDRVDIGSGGSTGAELVLTLANTAVNGEVLAATVASAGDFNGDGASDLAMSYTNTSSGSDVASVFVVYGSNTLKPIAAGVAPESRVVPTAANVSISGGKASEGFGSAIACGGYLDGATDTFAELLIGARGTAVSGNAVGAAHVIKGAAGASSGTTSLVVGSSPADARVITLAGAATNKAFGQSVAFVGDMDGDKMPEFAVSDPELTAGAGAVYLFSLKGTTLPAGPADATATVQNDVTSAAGNRFGKVVLGAAAVDMRAGADVNGDKAADLLSSAEKNGALTQGVVFQFNGVSPLSGLSTSKASFTFVPPGAGVTFGQTALYAKDINGDGYPDLVIGDPGHDSGAGRFLVYY